MVGSHVRGHGRGVAGKLRRAVRLRDDELTVEAPIPSSAPTPRMVRAARPVPLEKKEPSPQEPGHLFAGLPRTGRRRPTWDDATVIRPLSPSPKATPRSSGFRVSVPDSEPTIVVPSPYRVLAAEPVAPPSEAPTVPTAAEISALLEDALKRAAEAPPPAALDPATLDAMVAAAKAATKPAETSPPAAAAEVAPDLPTRRRRSVIESAFAPIRLAVFAGLVVVAFARSSPARSSHQPPVHAPYATAENNAPAPEAAAAAANGIAPDSPTASAPASAAPSSPGPDPVAAMTADPEPAPTGKGSGSTHAHSGRHSRASHAVRDADHGAPAPTSSTPQQKDPDESDVNDAKAAAELARTQLQDTLQR
jgi:hypothetical protein